MMFLLGMNQYRAVFAECKTESWPHQGSSSCTYSEASRCHTFRYDNDLVVGKDGEGR